MSNVAIRVENLGKQYRIGAAQSSYKTLRESIVDKFAAPFRLFRKSAIRDPQSAILWALKDVSFEIKQGEVVGVIGRNGAGKSTLLKVLSRITEPTEGRVEIHGRVGSLLEVGTGFHPELTGRENIYLNGAILGMRRGEIERKFDEIVAFSEVERFIDTPVKHYSSGMYVRLAFAVAAHLEPETLLVDEVLAVGDAAFQQKCLGKMGSVAKQGRTVLFVSHNMQAIRKLCQRALLLQDGGLQCDGPVDVSTEHYLQSIPRAEGGASLENLIRELPADPAFRLLRVTLTQDGKPAERVLNGRPLEVEVHYEVLQKTTGLRVFFDLCDTEETLLFRSFHDEAGDGIPVVTPGRYVSKARIPSGLLAPTSYELRILATVYNVRMCVPYPGICMRLEIEATGNANRAYASEPIRGKLAPEISWVTHRAEDSAPTQRALDQDVRQQ